MKWQGRRGSRNIEDRRRRGGQAGGEPSRGPSRDPSRGPVGGVKLGGVGLLIVLALGYFLDVDVSSLLEGQGPGTSTTISTGGEAGGEITEADRQAGQFVSVTLADTEEVWAGIFNAQVDGPYDPVTLVLYKGVTQSACGGATGATGPFYCPGDGKIFLDTAFFATMANQLGASGDFAAAYVVAHEVAHHVQDELGILSRANQERARVSEAASNAISVQIELQADCYSGIWAREAGQMFHSIERGDIREALNAAKQIGDDTLQRNAGRTPMPHTFTHGTSAQRQAWFQRGFDSGSLRECDTFAAGTL